MMLKRVAKGAALVVILSALLTGPPSSAHGVRTTVVQFASAFWAVGRCPASCTVYTIEAERDIDLLGKTTSNARVVATKCRGNNCKPVFNSGTLRIPESAFRFDPTLGSASVVVRTGRYKNRVGWTGGLVALPLNCGFGLFIGCLGCDGNLSVAQPVGAARLAHARGVLLGRHFSDEVGEGTPFYALGGTHVLALVVFTCAGL
jgi:hypothetical protein